MKNKGKGKVTREIVAAAIVFHEEFNFNARELSDILGVPTGEIYAWLRHPKYHLQLAEFYDVKGRLTGEKRRKLEALEKKILARPKGRQRMLRVRYTIEDEDYEVYSP